MLPEIGGIFKKYALHWILLRGLLKVPFVFGSSVYVILICVIFSFYLLFFRGAA